MTSFTVLVMEGAKRIGRIVSCHVNVWSPASTSCRTAGAKGRPSDWSALGSLEFADGIGGQ